MSYLVKQPVTGPEMLAEGIVEIGACAGTNVVYVKTQRRLILFYADQVASWKPQLSPWGLQRAREMIDLGHNVLEVSQRFGFDGRHEDLFKQLREVGLVQGRSRPLSTSADARKKRAKYAARKSASRVAPC